MKHLETFQASAEFLGKDPLALPGVELLPEAEGKAVIAFYKLSVISEASWKKEKKKIDWTNSRQYKYYGWFDFSSGSASGFSYGDYACDLSFSGVGSRLVFPSRDIARYVGETHLELYKDLMLK